MKKILFLTSLFLTTSIWAATEVRLATHDSFDLPKEVLNQFEKQHDAKLNIVKMGDGHEMLNRLIITHGKTPLADVVFGLDNSTVFKAKNAGILHDKQPESLPTVGKLKHILAVDYGFISLNYDKAWFEKHQIALPKSLDDLTKPQYKDLLIMPNPATSTPGLGFLLANIGGLGEEKAFAWWAAMRKNGVKVTRGWSDAYYKEFSLNGGARPLMVGYASSPAADVFYSEGSLKTSRMGNVFLNGGNYLQIEGAAVLSGTKQPELASKLVQFLQSQTVQKSVFTSMWVYPAVKPTPHPKEIIHTSVPNIHFAPSETDITNKQQDWIKRWNKVVLK